jgi:addiction module HigA family antidote
METVAQRGAPFAEGTLAVCLCPVEAGAVGARQGDAPCRWIIGTTTGSKEVTRMHNPPHPGEVLKDGLFTGTGITVTDFARRIGVTRVTLSKVLNGRNGVSADMAVRLAAAIGGSAESWLHMQARYDLAASEKALKKVLAKIEPLELPEAA